MGSAKIPILVTGMHKSGTSLACQVLNKMGLWFGPADEFAPPQPDNPKGYFELNPVRDLNERLFAWRNCTWSDPFDWASEGLTYEQRASSNKSIEDVLKTLNGDGRSFGLKDPRFCKTLPDWADSLEFRAIVVTRHPLEVARSLKKRNGFSLNYGLALWVEYQSSILRSLKDRPETIWLDFNELMARPRTVVERLASALGLSAQKGQQFESAVGCIDDNLYRSRVPDTNYKKLPSLVKELYENRYRYGSVQSDEIAGYESLPFKAEIEQLRLYYLMREFRVQSNYSLGKLKEKMGV